MISQTTKIITFILVSLASNSILLANAPSQAPDGKQTDSSVNSQKPTKQAPAPIEDTKSSSTSESVGKIGTEVKTDQAPNNQPENAQTQASKSKQRDWTAIEIVLSVAVILFGLIIMGIQTYLMIKLDLEWTPTAILRFHGLTMIITAGLLILTASYSQEQMAPVLGLLGTIAGYLLGSSDVPRKIVEKTTQEKT